jgi:hypothetical protein
MVNMSPPPNYQKFPLNIVGSSVFGRYSKISTEKTYNMIIADNALIQGPGYRSVGDISPSGLGRGLFNSIKYNHMVVAIDNELFAINSNLGFAKISDIDTSTGDVFFSENNNSEIATTDGLNIYSFNWSTGAFTRAQTDGSPLDFLPTNLDFIDGYLIAGDARSNEWRLSDLNDATNWPNAAPNVGSLGSQADYVVAVAVFNRQVFVFGKTITEIWYNVGQQLFPFQRNDYFSLSYGCLNAATIAKGSLKVNDSLIPIIAWLGVNKTSGITMMFSTGAQPQRISTDGINYKLEQLYAPNECYATMFELAGHTIYQVTFYNPRDNFTLWYDFTTQKFFNASDENQNYHIAKEIIFFSGDYYFVSINDGKLYQMGSDIDTYDEKEIPRIRITKNIRLDDSTPFILQELTLTLEQGDSSEEQAIDFSMSYDGGQTFGSSYRQPLNNLGHRLNKFNVRNLGFGNDLVPQFRFLGKTKCVVLGGEAKIYQ